MEHMVPALVLWIATATGWAVPQNLPAIAPMTPEISARLGGMACASFIPSIGSHGTIVLGSCARDEDLVHELTHVFQRSRGEDPQTSREECLFELKAEELENRWRSEHGLPEDRPYRELCGKFMKEGGDR